jgi:uncharacterized protein (TIGR02271 family)
MLNKTGLKREKGSLTRNTIIGALIGGGIGAALGLLGIVGNLVSTTEGIIALAIIGASVGAVVGILVRLSTRDNITNRKSGDNSKQNLKKTFKNISDAARLQLREEQLEISKELVNTADVTSHKEVITEEKTITVPVSREELVIEKRSLENNAADDDSEHSEIMRIPLTEEQVEVVKNNVKLEDVSIHTNKYQENEHIVETIKKEKAHIETSGDVTVVDENPEEK